MNEGRWKGLSKKHMTCARRICQAQVNIFDFNFPAPVLLWKISYGDPAP